jgi:cysteine-rich repeat protein
MDRLRTQTLLLGGSIALAVACGRTGLEGDLVDSGGASAEGGAGGSFGGATGGSFAGHPGGGTTFAGNGGQPLAGQAGMSAAGAAGMRPFACGNGVLEPGEACDPGGNPAPSALELRQGAFRAEVAPIVGVDSANRFYRYESDSSHTGFEALRVSRLYLYRRSAEEQLSLVMHHGIEEEASGLVQPESAVTFDIEGLPPTGMVSLSDEANEFFRSTPTTAHADWTFRRNTDGGIIGGLPFPGSWHLIVMPRFIAGVDAWTFYSGNGQADLGVAETFTLDLGIPVEIVASGSCRVDCTRPFCGDAWLDPGEVCDDGNDIDGDGCSDCRPMSP